MLKNKRLNSEYQKLISQKWIANITTQDQFLWIVEFAETKGKVIKIELGFSNYPISPPSIKMLSNIQIAGLIGNNGEIKIKLIEPGEWKITNNLVEITEFLSNCFAESI
jgi:ubiquitin-protein ligase